MVVYIKFKMDILFFPVFLLKEHLDVAVAVEREPCRRGRVQLQEQTLSVFVVKAIEFPSLCVPRPWVQLVTQY